MIGGCYELLLHGNTRDFVMSTSFFYGTGIYTNQMSKKPLNISEEAAVQMPMKTVASLIAMIAVGTWAYFGIHEKLNQHSTKIELMTKDLEQNSEFRIKYPRGELGQSSGEADLFMLYFFLLYIFLLFNLCCLNLASLNIFAKLFR